MSLPKWTDPLLQGLSYWIGYKKQLYPHHPLSEGAIVAESQNLIYSRLEKGQKLYCEYPYTNIINVKNENRVDLVITENDKPSVVIEVKRIEAGMSLIYRDFEKLLVLKSGNKNLKCFVLLVCQQKIPKKFVRRDGISFKGKISIKSIDVKVLRTCKSTNSFKKEAISKANYVSLIEVL